MDLVDRKAVLEAMSLGMTVTQLERAIMAIPGVAVDEVLDDHLQVLYKQFDYWKYRWMRYNIDQG
jgi:hypothetical protein